MVKIKHTLSVELTNAQLNAVSAGIKWFVILALAALLMISASLTDIPSAIIVTEFGAILIFAVKGTALISGMQLAQFKFNISG